MEIKEMFEIPEIEILTFGEQDIMTASGDLETPPDFFG